MIQNRTINTQNASKRMSNSLSCLEILTKYIGFEKTNNGTGETLTLPDEVKIVSLICMKNLLIQFKDNFEVCMYV